MKNESKTMQFLKVLISCFCFLCTVPAALGGQWEYNLRVGDSYVLKAAPVGKESPWDIQETVDIISTNNGSIIVRCHQTLIINEKSKCKKNEIAFLLKFDKKGRDLQTYIVEPAKNTQISRGSTPVFQAMVLPLPLQDIGGGMHGQTTASVLFMRVMTKRSG